MTNEYGWIKEFKPPRSGVKLTEVFAAWMSAAILVGGIATIFGA